VGTLFDENQKFPMDFDALKAVGTVLAKSGHEKLDWDVIAITTELKPDSKRLFTASALLTGLWSSARVSTIDPKTIDAFQKARQQKSLKPKAENAIKQAFNAAVESKKLPAGYAAKLKPD